MDKKEYQVKNVMPGISILYGFQEECCIYVVEGTEKVDVIDNGMGTGDLPSALERLAPGKPVLAFNTHCHFDHSGGNYQFAEVYMHPGCFADQDEVEASPVLPIDGNSPQRRPARRVPIHEGDSFDLGGVQLEVLETPGHTPGCVCFLDCTHRILFAGDLIGTTPHCVWLLERLPWVRFTTVSVECYHRSLNKLKAREIEFDGILAGHDMAVLGKEYLDELLGMSASILAGTEERYHPEMPAPPGMEPIVCWRTDSKRLNTAILYHDEVVFDKQN